MRGPPDVREDTQLRAEALCYDDANGCPTYLANLPHQPPVSSKPNVEQ